MTRLFGRMCIIGCGLIGGSVSMAFRRTGRVDTVVGVDAHRETLHVALTRGIIDEMCSSIEEGIRGADLVVIATPVPIAVGNVQEISCHEDLLAPGAIVTDVCSTKSRIVEQARRHLTKATFIGGHPMAGSEKSGVTAADARLLENAVYVLTPTSQTPPDAVEEFTELLRAAGSRVEWMSPQVHDRVVAAISHVPHLIAAALVNQVQTLSLREPYYVELAAGGFRDVTRIASSDPVLWRDISLENRAEILPLVEDWIDRLERLRGLIAKSDELQIERFFRTARSFRDALPAKATGAIRAVFSMTVSVPDEPGMIGKISVLLGDNDISIRNIGILESREEDDGQLLLQFDTVDFHDRALDLLTRHGYVIRDLL